MNTGEMLLAAGGIMLMAFVFLNVNKGFENADEVLLTSKLNVIATSLAASIIEEASGKSFDERSIGAQLENRNDLSKPHKLGTDEEDQNYPDFDDFDDFNEFFDTTSIVGINYRIDCVVDYVDENDPEVVLSDESWLKKITVHVSSPYMTDTVSLSYVYSYFFFR